MLNFTIYIPLLFIFAANVKADLLPAVVAKRGKQWKVESTENTIKKKVNRNKAVYSGQQNNLLFYCIRF